MNDAEKSSIINKPTVALTRCLDYEGERFESALTSHLNLLGGLETYVSRGDKVLIKPNLIAPKPREKATQTDPALILSIARRLKDYGAKPFVGDSPAWNTAEGCLKKLGIDDALKKLDVPIIQFNKPVRCVVEPAGVRVGISRHALEADKIINLPKLKGHQQMTATFAIKNMFGCVCGKEKPLWHFRKGDSDFDFSELLISIYRKLSPVLTILDGVVAMEGPGPINGYPRPLGWLISSTDPIACETIATQLIDWDPDDLPIIRTARKMNFGTSNLEKIAVVGDEYHSHICRDFMRPDLIPIRFSLGQVCKSAAKQVWINCKSLAGKDHRRPV